MEEAHERLLKMLDEAYQKVRFYHSDKNFWQRENDLYERAWAEFIEAQNNLFMLKVLICTLNKNNGARLQNQQHNHQ